ncbi:DUF4942 domain-containing protein [Aeromonas caviae]|uniref:DUF4942 domain-containing protein n=1 Tax=Aeromonas caviae TaxID=648 RepID=A0AAV4YF60_AERCA|nr:DUF4942 domain-containing protein [Aeromonas caviae]GJA39633.1 hypothetical protein KAM343_04290 [Aeromonas caviae]GJA44449.1 hypothetical protein KAM346_07380 [Aeromonas caviae]
MADLQFFPTDKALADKAASLFKTNVVRLLEPSAGRADLLEPTSSWRYRRDTVDCVEIDPDNRAILKEKGYNVVGTDFLAFDPGAIYSHVLMNPPFKVGAEHTLHAWSLLFSGELVAILNAETVRNPCTAAREQLLRLIQDYSATPVEFIQGAFTNPDTKRKTDVEVALIHLLKPSQVNFDFVGRLRKEELDKTLGEERFSRPLEVMLPESEIENRLIDYQCAVKTMKIHRHAALRAAYFRSRLGVALNAPTPADECTAGLENTLIENMHRDYQLIKDAAWSSVIRSVDVRSRLSSQAQKILESQFEEIRKMDFTRQNLEDFVLGLVQQQGSIQTEMMLEVFDLFSRYYLGNRCYFKGWKSNAKHRQNAFRLKMTRIVLPGCSAREMKDWRRAGYSDQGRFADIDKAFAMMDMKRFEDVKGLAALFSGGAKIPAGERFQTDYFDVRVFYDAGTYHLFPRRSDLVDKLNRFVGRHRNWLPHDDSAAPAGFWEQFEAAEKVGKALKFEGLREWDILREDTDQVREKIDAAITKAQAGCGIEFFPDALEAREFEPVMLLEERLAG